ncbi:acyltransferase [Thalassotalea psychrophila]|uniref:Acyltransferase n=1 Tax=Thalassotalea psychrophila TaxID=3065647 RepID=A0ABY9TUU8_9GAMM|nr:acyltransferase [Colwelliaceae bacterium SQ149]
MKNKSIKKFIQIISLLIMLVVILAYKLLAYVFAKDATLTAFSQLLSLLPGKFGSYLRTAFYRFSITHCDQDAMVCFGVLLSQTKTEIHQGVYIGPQSNIGSAIIEKNCLLGSAVHILSGKKQHYFNELTMPIKEQGGEYTQIRIGENSWLGNGSIIMANVGKNCIIAAGSVLFDDIPDNSIALGNPAKVVKTRISNNEQ